MSKIIPRMGGFTFTEEAGMVYPDLADEIDKLIQELDAKIKALHALKIDKEGNGRNGMFGLRLFQESDSLRKT